MEYICWIIKFNQIIESKHAGLVILDLVADENFLSGSVD